MAKKKGNKALPWILVAIAIISVFAILVFSGCIKIPNLPGSENQTPCDNDTPNQQTHDPCAYCQARWINLHNWECSGICGTGTCQVKAGTPDYYLTNPFQEIECICSDVKQEDTCHMEGSRCVGTCAQGSYCTMFTYGCRCSKYTT